jgi:hypothetical protein
MRDLIEQEGAKFSRLTLKFELDTSAWRAKLLENGLSAKGIQVLGACGVGVVEGHDAVKRGKKN